MTRLYLDTEFNEHAGELISMALVMPVDTVNPMLPPGCEQFYEARQWFEPTRRWVKENVVPKLGKPPLPHDVFRQTFHNWIRCFDNPEIICDWNADAAYFCNMLAGDGYGTSLDFACRLTILCTPPGQPVSKNPHNALADAEALRDWHQQLVTHCGELEWLPLNRVANDHQSV